MSQNVADMGADTSPPKTTASRQNFPYFQEFNWNTIAITNSKRLDSWTDHTSEITRIASQIEEYRFSFSSNDIAAMSFLGYAPTSFRMSSLTNDGEAGLSTVCNYLAAFRMVDVFLRLQGVQSVERRSPQRVQIVETNALVAERCFLKDWHKLVEHLRKAVDGYMAKKLAPIPDPRNLLEYCANGKKKPGIKIIIDNLSVTALHIRALLRGKAREDGFPDIPEDQEEAIEVYKSIYTIQSSREAECTEFIGQYLRQMRLGYLRSTLLTPLLILGSRSLRKSDVSKRTLLSLSFALGNNRPEVVRSLEDIIWKAVFNLAEKDEITESEVISIVLELSRSKEYQKVEEFVKNCETHTVFHFNAEYVELNKDPGGNVSNTNTRSETDSTVSIDVGMLNGGPRSGMGSTVSIDVGMLDGNTQSGIDSADSISNRGNLTTALQSALNSRSGATDPNRDSRTTFGFQSEDEYRRPDGSNCVDPRLLGGGTSELDLLFGPLSVTSFPTSNPVSPVQRMADPPVRTQHWEDDDVLDYGYTPPPTPSRSSKNLSKTRMDESTYDANRVEEREKPHTAVEYDRREAPRLSLERAPNPPYSTPLHRERDVEDMVERDSLGQQDHPKAVGEHTEGSSIIADEDQDMIVRNDGWRISKKTAGKGDGIQPAEERPGEATNKRPTVGSRPNTRSTTLLPTRSVRRRVEPEPLPRSRVSTVRSKQHAKATHIKPGQAHPTKNDSPHSNTTSDRYYIELDEEIWAAGSIPCDLNDVERPKLEEGKAFIAYGPNKEEKEEVLARVHNQETLDDIKLLVNGVERIYVDGVPLHFHQDPTVSERSVFRVVTDATFKALSDKDVQEILRHRHIVIHGQPQKSFTFKEALLTLGGGLDRKTEIQDQSLPWKANNNKFIRQGSLRELCRHAESPTGNTLNALSFPMGQQSMEPTPFASDTHALLFTTETPGWKESSQFPTGDFRWGVVSTAGTYTGWHLDSNGLCTYVSPLTGSKWWVVARPVNNLNHSAFEDIALCDDPAFNLNGNWEKNGRRLFDLEAVLLKPGSRLIMRPNTLHAVFTPQSSVVHGGHFYSTSTMRDSLAGMFHTFVNDRYLANTTHISAGISLRRMVAMCYHALVEGKMEKEDPAFPHVPDLSSVDGLTDLISMCNAVYLLNAIDTRTYEGEKLNPAQQREWTDYDLTPLPSFDRLANQYARGQCRKLVEWVNLRHGLSTIEPTDGSPETVSITEIHNQLLRHHCKLLLLYKQSADKRKVPCAELFTVKNFATQLKAVYQGTFLSTDELDASFPVGDDLGAEGTKMFVLNNGSGEFILEGLRVENKDYVQSPSDRALTAKDLMKLGSTERDNVNRSYLSGIKCSELNAATRKRKRD